jgi:hypothetical protein
MAKIPRTPKTNPSRATRDEEQRDAMVVAGADAIDESAFPDADAEPDPAVAENYEEMTERGARQRGEGRLP